MLGAVETQLAVSVAARQPRAFLARTQYGADERLKHERIGNQTHLMGPSHPGQRQLLWQRTVDLLLGQQPERQLITGGHAVTEHFELAE